MKVVVGHDHAFIQSINNQIDMINIVGTLNYVVHAFFLMILQLLLPNYNSDNHISTFYKNLFYLSKDNIFESAIIPENSVCIYHVVLQLSFSDRQGVISDGLKKYCKLM